MKNYYDILCIPNDASVEDIKRSYKILAHQFHPDKEHGNEKYKISKNYTVAILEIYI